MLSWTYPLSVIAPSSWIRSPGRKGNNLIDFSSFTGLLDVSMDRKIATTVIQTRGGRTGDASRCRKDALCRPPPPSLDSQVKVPSIRIFTLLSLETDWIKSSARLFFSI